MIHIYALRDFGETVALIARGASLQIKHFDETTGNAYCSSKQIFIIQAGLRFNFQYVSGTKHTTT